MIINTFLVFVLFNFASAEITLLYLKGSDYYQLGQQYGTKFRQTLKWLSALLQDHYIKEKEIPFNDIYRQASSLYDRYCNDDYKLFIQGMADGSELSLKEAIIINGMETLHKYDSGCTYFYVPPTSSFTSEGIAGRYYDYSEPFDQAAKHLSITIIDDGKSIPIAIIGIVGEIMCLTCINKENIFISINNGSPSGGTYINKTANATLSKLIEVSQNAYSMKDAISYFPKTFKTDYSSHKLI